MQLLQRVKLITCSVSDNVYYSYRVDPPIIGHYHILDNNNENFSHAKSMHGKILRRIFIGPPTIGYMWYLQ